MVPAGESGRAYILVDPEGERTILVKPNTNDELRESDLPWGELEQARFLHLTSFAGDGPLAVQKQIPRRLEGGPRPTFDPGDSMPAAARAPWKNCRTTWRPCW